MLPKCCQTIERYLRLLPAISDERLAEAKKRFTPESIETIRIELNPPADFDLEGELWVAVHLYHFYSEPSVLEAMSPKQQREKLAAHVRKCWALEGMMHELRDDLVGVAGIRDKQLIEIGEACGHLLDHYQNQMRKLPPVKAGRHTDNGQRSFFNSIAMIHKITTGQPAPWTFFKLCHDLLIGYTFEDRNTRRIVADLNRAFFKTA
jgi:hypothetical protein